MLASDMQQLTPADVEARLPLLVRIADDIVEAWTARRLVRELRRAAGRGRTAEAEGLANGSASATSTAEEVSLDLRSRDEERRLTQTLTDLAGEVEQLGGALLDPSVGILEFPGLLDGRLVMLSWRRGEERVRYFRSLDAPRGVRSLLPGMEPPPAEEAEDRVLDLEGESEGYA